MPLDYSFTRVLFVFLAAYAASPSSRSALAIVPFGFVSGSVWSYSSSVGYSNCSYAAVVCDRIGPTLEASIDGQTKFQAKLKRLFSSVFHSFHGTNRDKRYFGAVCTCFSARGDDSNCPISFPSIGFSRPWQQK